MRVRLRRGPRRLESLMYPLGPEAYVKRHDLGKVGGPRLASAITGLLFREEQLYAKRRCPLSGLKALAVPAG